MLAIASEASVLERQRAEHSDSSNESFSWPPLAISLLAHCKRAVFGNLEASPRSTVSAPLRTGRRRPRAACQPAHWHSIAPLLTLYVSIIPIVLKQYGAGLGLSFQRTVSNLSRATACQPRLGRLLPLIRSLLAVTFCPPLNLLSPVALAMERSCDSEMQNRTRGGPGTAPASLHHLTEDPVTPASSRLDC